jgi:hypothetical protein
MMQIQPVQTLEAIERTYHDQWDVFRTRFA